MSWLRLTKNPIPRILGMDNKVYTKDPRVSVIHDSEDPKLKEVFYIVILINSIGLKNVPFKTQFLSKINLHFRFLFFAFAILVCQMVVDMNVKSRPTQEEKELEVGQSITSYL